MLYMGSNQEDCTIVANIINEYIDKKGKNETECFDLTVGGANILDKIEAKTLWGYDISPTLISLHMSMTNPHSGSLYTFNKEMWDACYHDYKILHQQKGNTRTLDDYDYYAARHGLKLLHVIGEVEWYGSFGHGGFSQGMTPIGKRDYYKEARMAHLEQRMTTNYPYINFRLGHYAYVDTPPSSVIIAHICSSKNYQWCGKFEKFPFYKWALAKSKTNPIFIIDDNPLADIKKIETLKNGNLYFLNNM